MMSRIGPVPAGRPQVYENMKPLPGPPSVDKTSFYTSQQLNEEVNFMLGSITTFDVLA